MTQNVLLGGITTKIGSGATPRGGASSYMADGPFALIRSQNVRDGVFDYNGLAYISENQASRLNNVEVRKGDVLINITGDSVARVGRAPEDILPARVNQHVAIIRPDQKAVDSGFLYYSLIDPRMNKRLLTIASAGATRNALTKIQLEKLKIGLPDLETQKKIANILGSIDEKIELNRQMNETLEQMGQALFRHYFIDNPEAEKWKVGYLSSQVDIRYGKNLPTKNLQESGYPVFGGNGQIGYYEKYIYEDPMVLVACRGAASGDINISKPKSFVTNNSLALEIKSGSDFTFEYLRFYSYSRKSGYREFVSGSAQPQITVDSLSRCQIPVPPRELIVNFTTYASVIVDQIRANGEQGQTLTLLRDTLLPRLISGKVKV